MTAETVLTAAEGCCILFPKYLPDMVRTGLPGLPRVRHTVRYNMIKDSDFYMSNEQKNEGTCKMADSIAAYAAALMADGARVVTAEKTARIAARPAVPGEQILSWTVDSEGKPLLEKTAAAAEGDWVAAKVDSRYQVITDANGKINEWIISAEVFRRKYEALPGLPGIYKPAGGAQKFIRVAERVCFLQQGEAWTVDQGGYINVTDLRDAYPISERDFRDSYRIIAG